ncbi:MAG TPA: phosphonate ABC transporter, permease protein PhnE [Oceanithermus profundus]|uniref:Phosphonate ABC transporter, permease protein PhnE n=1 Tax=Oceanithermus profundus TaxID=187137 RepID=A0A7C4VAV6_9DEIN|nr:phosphonate ABC transporter, permease protein PhnE [Oceanithermus profundus]
MSWLFPALGVLVAVLTSVSRGSARRYLYAAGAGLLVAFFAFPFASALGYLSREAVHPTPAGLLPSAPWLVLLALAALAALVPWPLRVHGWVGGAGGLVVLALVLAWTTRPVFLARVVPLPGVMETALGLTVALLAFVLLRARGLPVALVATVLLGGATFGLLASPAGHTYFPRIEGYYKTFVPVSAEETRALIARYNAGLDKANALRAEIGLKKLEPIRSLVDLEGGLPKDLAREGVRLVRPASLRYGTLAALFLAGLMLASGFFLARNPGLAEENDLAGGLVAAGVFSVLVPSFYATEFSLAKLVEGWPFFVNFLDRAWPPNLADPAHNVFPLQEVASQMALTVEIALVGTFLAMLFAVPTSFLAARNLTRGSGLTRALFTLMRAFYNVDRGVDTLILALVFVAAVGLGPFAGVLAMAIHSIADLGKLYSEAIENVEKGPIEALEAVGASGTGVVRWAILPQVLPLFVAYTLYRFEINFRVSIVLGFVGAGGIGFFIQNAMASGMYDQMIIGILAIVLVVNLIDFGSSWLRSKLV